MEFINAMADIAYVVFEDFGIVIPIFLDIANSRI